MMNLLIAMLSDTYGDAVRHADKTWRIDRARRVLRLELLQSFLFGGQTTTLGVQVLGPDTPYYFGFKGIAPNPEGRVPEGGGNPFDGEHDEKFNPVSFLFSIADHPDGFTHAPSSKAEEEDRQHTRAGTRRGGGAQGGFVPIADTPPGLKGWPTESPPGTPPERRTARISESTLTV